MERRAFTYESVTAAIHLRKRVWYAAAAFGKGLYFSTSGRYWTKAGITMPKGVVNILSLRKHPSGMLIETDNSLYLLKSPFKKLLKLPFSHLLKKGPSDYGINCLYTTGYKGVVSKTFSVPLNRNGKRWRKEAYDRLLRQRKASGKKSIYIYTYLARPFSRLKSFVRQIKKTSINSVVIDMKDDWGQVVYDSKLKIVKKTGARKPLVNIRKILAYFKKNGIYAIARIVVFKDRRLFFYKKGKYAIRDKRNGRPWIGGHSQREYWVDPNSSFVWDYNIKIAEELVALGFDEIQFDYIRFPTDGHIYRCRYPYRKKGMNKARALGRFLQKARQRIRVPISIDIYGFNGWYKMGDKQGQDINIIRKYVDVICPMYYPSHFGRMFMAQDAYRILYAGTLRAKYFTGSYAIIRPYLQSFPHLARNYGRGYINDQIKGVKNGGGNGYLFWNMAGRYGVVYRALKIKRKRK